MNRRIAHRYALALIGLAEELKILDPIADDMHSLEETIRDSRGLKILLGSPVVSPDRKLKVLREIFDHQLQEQTMAFVSLLVRKGRSEYLFATAEEFLNMLDARRGILHARIQSASTLSEEQRIEVQAKLERMTGKRIRPAFSLDPELRGGFIARIGDELVDASLSHQLELLREQFQRGGSPILN
ncbi:MAG: ATP synthase F1 subunit delta [Bacteroidota bacterium]|nr:ATP synthase F1 subunit delta [Bacteroidota bacterium]MDP4233459.1 ATP synthase F1 subunit delta [Bacteroidota bacterium]MDP4242325.1 ATP synthase F1 subunit delta [Bacteroidota bacterium]MDP4287081.1 ATP synthase F1 subunit delta [Bacteroidota bacterium]